MNQDQLLREQLAAFLDWQQAHADFSAAVADFPARLRGRVPEGAPYSAWQLLEHIRISLWDILEFSRNSKHKSPKWPEGYWPKAAAPPSVAAWNSSAYAVLEHLEAMRALVRDPACDLFRPLPHGSGQTLLREILLVADHNAYHIGELVLLRRLLDAWTE